MRRQMRNAKCGMRNDWPHGGLVPRGARGIFQSEIRNPKSAIEEAA